MTIYKVKHTAIVEYIVIVEADNEEQAMNRTSYFAASSFPASDHYWNDSEIMEILSDNDEADLSLIGEAE